MNSSSVTPPGIQMSAEPEASSVVLKLDPSGQLKFSLSLPEDPDSRTKVALMFLAGLADIFLKNLPVITEEEDQLLSSFKAGALRLVSTETSTRFPPHPAQTLH